MFCSLSSDRPTITNFECSNRTDDIIVLVCEVECYLPYNITWLYGGENIAVLNRTEKYFTSCNDSESFLLVRNASNADTKKNYTCVVDTSYRRGDAMKVFSFCKLSSSAALKLVHHDINFCSASNDEGIQGHHPAKDKSMFASFVLMVLPVLALIAVIVAYMKIKKHSKLSQYFVHGTLASRLMGPMNYSM